MKYELQLVRIFFKTCPFIKATVCHGHVLIKGIFTTKVKRNSGIEKHTRSHSKNLMFLYNSISHIYLQQKEIGFVQ